MQTRSLFALALLGVLLAGCAQQDTPGTDNGDATPPASVSNEAAAALFSEAANNIPDKFGMNMAATKNGTDLMTVEASFDNTTHRSFFRMQMDPSLTEDMGSGASMMGGDAEMFQDFTVYVTPEGNAIQFNDTVILTKPDDSTFDQATGGEDGFGFFTDPESFVGEMDDDGFTVTSVTPTTLRGKGALKIEATINDTESGTGTQSVTAWLFQNPTRLARIEAAMPVEEAEEGEEMEDPFQGANMAIDFLYDNEVTVTIPNDLVRALGLRYESNREPFDFGGGEDQGPEVRTFQVDGGLALSEIEVEVGQMGEEEPQWTMKLSDLTKTEGGVTITFADVDADGKVSEGDTLTIQTAEDGMPMQVTLRDTVTGLRVAPGAGLVVAILALAAIALLVRRK